MKIYQTIIIILFASVLLATNDWVYNLTNEGWIASAYVNSTNLIVKNKSSGGILMASYDRWNNDVNSSPSTPGYGGEFIISTNRITDLFNGWVGVSYEFTPVSYTNQMVGFKIIHRWTGDPPWDYVLNGPNILSNVFYVALSDTPVEVGEADVENPNLAKQEDED